MNSVEDELTVKKLKDYRCSGELRAIICQRFNEKKLAGNCKAQAKQYK